jgi:hypothetical protein
MNYGFTDFNRNIGIEYNLASADNVWTGKAVVMKSFNPKKVEDELLQAYNLNYISNRMSVSLQYENIGQNYSPEMGYVPRRGYYRVAMPNFKYFIYPKNTSSKAFFNAPIASFDYYWNTNGDLTDAIYTFGYFTQRKPVSYFFLYFQSEFYKLQYDFDPTNGIANQVLKAGTEHRFNSINFEYVSAPRKKFITNFNGTLGGYFGDSKLVNLGTTIGYRFQPYVNISANINYVDISNIKIPQSGQSDKIINSHFFLVSPKIDISFTNKLFWTTFVQYNEQRQNTNINSRLQWRYKPASDIFLVYTDNYFPNSYEIKNRAVVLKMTYWLNL